MTMTKAALPYKIIRRDKHTYAVATCECGNAKELSLSKSLPSDVVLKKFAEDGWQQTSKFGKLLCGNCLMKKPAKTPVAIVSTPLKANEHYMDIKIYFRQNMKNGKPSGKPQLRFQFPQYFLQVTQLELKPRDIGFDIVEDSKAPDVLKFHFKARDGICRCLSYIEHAKQWHCVASVATFGWDDLTPRFATNITVGGIYNRLTHTLKFNDSLSQLRAYLETAEEAKVFEEFEKKRKATAIEQEIDAASPPKEYIDPDREGPVDKAPARALPAVPVPIEPISEDEEQILNAELRVRDLQRAAKGLLAQLNDVRAQLNQLGWETRFYEEGVRLADDIGRPVKLSLAKKINL